MNIELGMDVYATDGDKVGTVEKIVVDSNTKQIHKFILHRGFLTHDDKLVDIDMVTLQDSEGLRIDLTSDQVNELPAFVEERFVEVPQHERESMPFIVPNAMGAGSYLYGAPNIGRGYEGSQDSMFDAAPAAAPVVEVESNIPETDVMISEGTDVYGSDGDKLGSVGNVLVDDSGSITGFVVTKGLIFKKDVRIPIDWVETANESDVRLNMTTAQAEADAYDVEESTL